MGVDRAEVYTSTPITDMGPDVVVFGGVGVEVGVEVGVSVVCCVQNFLGWG